MIRDFFPLLAWLRALPAPLRRLRGMHMPLLADEAVLPDLEHAQSVFDTLQDAADGICLLSEHALHDRRVARRLLRLLLREPRILDLGLLLALAYLSLLRDADSQRLRVQPFYPSSLVDGFLADLSGSGRSDDVSAVLSAIGSPAWNRLWAPLERHAASLQQSLVSGAIWPRPAQAATILQHLCELRPAWEAGVATLLHGDSAVASVMPATRRQREQAALMRHALSWPQRASAVFRCLAEKEGWLRLYCAYLNRITPCILQRCATDPEAVLEISQRELFWPCARLISLAGPSPSTLPSSLWAEPPFLPSQKQRLYRMREACLAAALHPPGPEFIAMLRQVALGYYDASLVSRRSCLAKSEPRLEPSLRSC